MRIRISEGNRKLGSIPSVSLPPVVTCLPGVPCAAGTCYVIKNMLRGPYGKTIAASYRANLELLKADREEYHAQLLAWIQRKRPHMFRFHVSGDFIDADHLLRSLEICRQTAEHTRYLAFTKRHDLLPRRSKLPRNVSIVASMWSAWGNRPRGYRAAWVQDGTEMRIPKNALQCPGLCESCGFCWDIYKLRRDVWFRKH